MPPRLIRITLTLLLIFIQQSVYPQVPSLKLHRGGISDRDVLGIGPPQQRLRSAFSSSKGVAATDTLRILAIRVDFQEDSNTLTTGNGKFLLTAAEDAFVDPPPHNRTYFENQLLALANYFRAVSDGQLTLEFDVLPSEINGAFTVSQPMSFYSPTRDEELLDQRLSELFAEGLQLAEASGEIDFSQYDSYMLFHAGVGLDFAFDFDPTPQDIPSVFLDFPTLREKLGNNDPNYPGISVNDGNFFVRDGMLLPETQSQEGFQIGLLGTIALMFGHQLGLPNLFNTDNGRAGIGVFGLMDQGSGNFSGLLPAEPCAWSKVFLGWETPIEIRTGNNLQVASPNSLIPQKIYKIPINSNEYFLIENRDRDASADNVAIGRDATGTRVELRWDDLGQRWLPERIDVLTQVNEYDFGLPGSGILIWHIDEAVIAERFAENRVNADLDRRGVDLEEADGAQDLGQIYDFLSAGAGLENGSIIDMFWGSNEINLLVNDSQLVEFTPTTKPNSASNSGANSHIFIDSFSEPAEVMTFSVREVISQTGFPQFVGESDIFTNSPTAVDLNGDNVREIVWASSAAARIFVWNADGTKFIPNNDSVERTKLNGDIETLPMAIFAEPVGTFCFSVASASLNNQHLVVVATDQSVAAYSPADLDGNGRADQLFAFQNGETFTTHPMVIQNTNDFSIIVGTAAGRVFAIDDAGSGTELAHFPSQSIAGFALYPSDGIAFTTNEGSVGLVGAGTILWQRETGLAISKTPVVGDFDKDGSLDIITVSDDGTISAFTANGNPLAGFPRATNIRPDSYFALADLNSDVFAEIVFVSDNQLYAFNHVGNLAEDFPIATSTSTATKSLSSPVLVDFAGDGNIEMLTGSNANQVTALQLSGGVAAQFPLSTGAAVNAAVAVSDLDNDGSMEMASVADDGFLYVWGLSIPFSPADTPWGEFLANSQHTNLYLDGRTPPAPAGELLPANLVYNYPNPTEGNLTTIRYSLNFPAQVRIAIFDLAGDLVDEFGGPGFAQVENEVSWRLDNIQSGVYLARVQAEGDGRKEVAIVKIAVVK
jgi:M6 family metalloprotease-like protein